MAWEEGARQMAGQAVKWRGLVVARPSPHSIAPEPTRRLPLPVIKGHARAGRRQTTPGNGLRPSPLRGEGRG
jgi:hypothetical protein